MTKKKTNEWNFKMKTSNELFAEKVAKWIVGLLIVGALAFWAVIIWVVVHFVVKWW